MTMENEGDKQDVHSNQKRSHHSLFISLCSSQGSAFELTAAIIYILQTEQIHKQPIQYVAQFSYGPSFRTKRTLFDYFRQSFESSSTEELQK